MNTPYPQKRPQFLTWLCTGSFVFGSLWIIMFFVLMISDQIGNISTQLFPGIAIGYLHAGYLFMIAEIVLTALGIFAVVMMWQMKKTGFYLYAVTKTVIYFLPVVAIGGHHLTFPALLLTSLLITAYGIMFTDESGNFRKFMLKK
jgi:hypothetical protein